MILNMKGCITTNVHLICISNYSRNRFLTLYPKLGWTENISFARTFNSKEEAFEFESTSLIQDFLIDELNMFIWTDTKESIFD
jgi:hypothetical protein